MSKKPGVAAANAPAAAHLHARASQRQPQRAAAADAIVLMSLSSCEPNVSKFMLNNYPPRATSSLSSSRQRGGVLPQHLRPIGEALRGLQENSEALGVQVGQAVAGGCKMGVSLHATRSFQKGDSLGYWWGVVLESQEQWYCIRDASAATATAQAAAAQAAGEEDYWSPAQHGLYRCLSVPMQSAHGGDHLLASEQCPMAYINESAASELANVQIVFPEDAFVPGEITSYAHIACRASRDIAAGEELLTQYAWQGAPRLYEEASRRYCRYHASLMQHSFAELADFDKMRAHEGRFASMTAIASTRFRSRADVAPAAAAAADTPNFSNQLPATATLAIDGRMQSFFCSRFMLCVPQADDAVLPLCQQWTQVADSDSRAMLDSTREGIRNGGHQIQHRAGHPLFATTVAAMRKAVQQFVGMQRASLLYCVGLVALSMQPGDGPMPFHSGQPCNSAKSRAHARECWSVLLYTSDCQGTALPLLTEDQMDESVHPDTAQSVVAQLLQPANFFAGRVSAGTMLVMRGDVPHCSPKHRGDCNRLTLYALFSPSSRENQIVNSQFPLGID